MAIFGPRRSSVQNFPFQMDISGFRINADLIKESTFRLAMQLGNMHWPLKTSVDNVIIPSMRRNFLVSGRPQWEPLALSTLNFKLSQYPSTSSFMPLIRTAKLLNIIGDGDAGGLYWRITNTKADMEALDRFVPYAKYHQKGTRTIPQRQFAVLQQEDIERIVVIFDSWIRITTSKKDFWPYKHKEF